MQQTLQIGLPVVDDWRLNDSSKMHNLNCCNNRTMAVLSNASSLLSPSLLAPFRVGHLLRNWDINHMSLSHTQAGSHLCAEHMYTHTHTHARVEFCLANGCSPYEMASPNLSNTSAADKCRRFDQMVDVGMYLKISIGGELVQKAKTLKVNQAKRTHTHRISHVLVFETVLCNDYHSIWFFSTTTYWI